MSASDVKIVAIIDDDRYLREALQDLLEAAGIAGELYASAEDFLSRKGYLTADCILTDVRMTGMSGLELLRLLRREGHSQPIVVMTSYLNVQAKAEALRNGASAFLGKPFDGKQLLSCLGKL